MSVYLVIAARLAEPRRPRLGMARQRRPRRPRTGPAAADAASRASAVLTAVGRLGRPVAPDAEAGRTTYRLARHARTRRPHHRRRTGRPARRARRGGRRFVRRHHEQGPPGPLPLQRGRGRHQRRAEPRRLLGVARLRHRQGLRLPRRPGRDRDHVPRGARRGALARAPGVTFHRSPEGKLGTRAFGGASAARTYYVADITGPGAAARALRAADEAPRDSRPLRGVVRHRRSCRTTTASAAARSRATSATARWSCSPPSP